MRNYLFILIIFLTLGVSAQSWTQKANFPGVQRYSCIAESFRNSVYFGLGLNNGTTYKKDIWQYIPSRDLWNYETSLPDSIGKSGCISFKSDTSFFVGLGWDGLNTYKTIYEYSLVNQNWTQKSNYPGFGGRNSFSAQIGKKVYVGSGGYNFNGVAYSDFFVYDIDSNNWSRLPNLPFSRVGAVSFAIDSILYVGMGHDFRRDYFDFWSYNPTTNQWASISNFPGNGRLQASSFVLNGKAIVGGGHRHGSNGRGTRADYYEYEPSSNTWTIITNNFSDSSRTLSRGFSSGNRGYLYGGSKNYPNSLNDLWEFQNGLTVGLKEISSSSIWKVFPNPSSNFIYLESVSISENEIVQFYNMQGKIVKEITLNSKREKINVEAWDAGIYFVRFQNQMKKIVITE